MRLFLAVDLDAAAAGAVAHAAERLRRRAEDRQRGLARTVRWVEPGRLHLTLHFLGEVEDSRLAGMQAALASPLTVWPARVGLGPWGVFPPAGAARVIWIGVTAGRATLDLGYAELGVRLAQAGITLEARPFAPHLTVGRVTRPAGLAWGTLVQDEPPALCEFAVSSCTLYQSRLSPGGPAYEPLLRIPFAGCPPGGPDADGTMS